MTPTSPPTKPTTRSDGDQTRMRILEVAGQLFADLGVSAITNKRVAEMAAVDLASINYHFGNRAGLYNAVLVEAHRRLVSIDYLQTLDRSELTAEEKLQQLLGFIANLVVAERGWNIRLLAREIVAPSGDIQGMIDGELLPKVAIVKHILAELTGFKNNDTRLSLLIVQLIGPCLMMLVINEKVPGHVQDVRQMQADQLTEQMMRFILAGVQALR